MPFAGIKTEYDPDILNRMLAQELGLQAQAQQIQSRGLQEALQAQLAPLQAQSQVLQIQKLQQALDPNFQAEQRAAELAQVEAVEKIRQQFQQPQYVYDASGRAFLPDPANPRNLIPATVVSEPIQMGSTMPGVSIGEISDEAILPELPSAQTQFVGRIPGKQPSTPTDEAFSQALKIGEKLQLIRNPTETKEQYIERINAANTSGLDEEKRTMALTFSQKLLDSPEYKNFNTASTSFGAMKNLVESSEKQGPTASNDIALIFNYMKTLDPTSTVREGEYATAQNAANVPDRIRNLWNKNLQSSGAFLNPKQRREFLGSAESGFKSHRTAVDRRRKTYVKQADQFGIPERFIPGVDDETIQAPSGGTKTGRFIVTPIQ